jgi:hypothetical protein
MKTRKMQFLKLIGVESLQGKDVEIIGSRHYCGAFKFLVGADGVTG